MSRHTILNATAALLLTGALVACATPNAETGTAQSELTLIHLTTAPTDDGQLLLRLENTARRPLKANLCHAELHQQLDQQWEPSEQELTWFCEDAYVIVNPGGVREARFDASALQPGRYRFTTSIEMPVGLDFKKLTSSAFDIVALNAPTSSDDVPTDESTPGGEEAPEDEPPTDAAPVEEGAPADQAPTP
ncbi:hypothetical protein DL240_18420 [Lujinxingia litoralis]|uniref:Intracellular proteinase inhibitor BsuPI domain-containing protein n=1 Tax=Lujinxingia litoralis TaxID=2211119 RepID=A0A328C1A3_9DELT|nr:hypothetical protein [Lujinxingia litoralis]RAL20193.1 hypothetical protein DL240_18420 [Lujinxingia litoralis]